MVQRPQVNTDLGSPETVRTVARPTNDRAPVYSVQQSRAGALAQSLMKIAPTLQGYVQEFQQDYQESEANRAYDQIQGMTYAEAQEAVQSGALMDTESPWYQAAFEKQFGTVYAARRKRELIDAYNNNFDKHNGNLDQFVAEFAGDDVEKFGGSEFIMAGYRNGMGGALQSLKDQHAEFKSSWTRERVSENFGSLAYDTVAQTVAEGGDLNAALGALKGEHRETFGLTFQDMDTNIFGLASRFAAEGNVEALEALLNTEIVGPDGTVIGSYMTRPKFAEDALKLLETGRANAGRTAREQNTATVVGLKEQASAGTLDVDLAATMREGDQISQAEYESLLLANSEGKRRATVSAQNQQQIDAISTAALAAVTSGQGYAVTDYAYVDANGKTQTITREKLVETAVLDSMQELAKRQTPPAVMAEQLSSYGVDVTYPVWENLLSDGYLTLTEALATSADGTTTIPETALSAYATYKALADTPQLRSRHINNTDAEKVWATAALLEQNGYSPEDALMRASKPPAPNGPAAANSFQYQEFEELAKVIDPGMFGDEVANGAAALGQTEALARFFISRGVPKRQAVEQAVKDYQASHTTINGASINTRNIHLPPAFEDASMVTLQQFAEAHGEDVDDLTMIPAHDGSNNWVIAYKGNVAMPVQIEGADSVVHVSQIERTYQQTQEEIERGLFESARDEVAYNAGRQAALEDGRREATRWLNMTRTERKAAGLPVSVIGGQSYFSESGILGRFEEDWENQQSGAQILDDVLAGDNTTAVLGLQGLTDQTVDELRQYLNAPPTP